MFLATAALLFTASGALTTRSAASMSSMDAMPMPGNWTMSMTWMRMPGQTWPGAAAQFVAMWGAMMAAMMLPSLLPTLWRYRKAVSDIGETRRATLTALVAAAYFFVWTAFGAALYPLGVTTAALEMRHASLARAVPTLAAMIVLIAGSLQFTAWKAHHLACCRDESASNSVREQQPDARSAWRYGLRLGLHCTNRCVGLTAVLLVVGVMDLRAMYAVTAAITLERFVPSGERAARMIGAVVIAAGVFLLARATGLV